ncbi:glycoside hydrolase family 18 protein [Fusarium flagelliforme]|uniref:Glycoside hydrolase family 18 protein n=1 Tax=Fusarium flagelliforme TaxID=2675880 RepID=A0A395MYJ9_9HYPO|nr:glycoside hydrolase family 18 protein [Fusarium flagelliforme]
MPAGYTKPSHQWVDEVLLVLGPTSRIVKESTWVEDNTWLQLTHGLGGDKQLWRLALADEPMNIRKKAQRNMAGVFYYMRDPDTWAKFTETSQWMENALDDFDMIYTYGGKKAVNVGELGIPYRDPRLDLPKAGLRDPYCYWIDRALNDMEIQASAWFKAVTNNYKRDFGDDRDGKAWLKQTLKHGGAISESILKFPRAAVSHNGPSYTNPDIWKQSNYQDLWLSQDRKTHDPGNAEKILHGLVPAGPF